MNQPVITLIYFGYFEDGFLEKVSRDVSVVFQLPVKIREGHLDLGDYLDTGRRQYNANDLLREVDMRYSGALQKTMGLFSIDLFIPILTYIFGQAVLKGNTGIASLYRFSNERYGMKKDEGILLIRFAKEIIHELGHTFGLIHCHDPLCVMRSSTYVEDIDQKGMDFCFSCRQLINRASKS